jgi:hypothetical protein
LVNSWNRPFKSAKGSQLVQGSLHEGWVATVFGPWMP